MPNHKTADGPHTNGRSDCKLQHVSICPVETLAGTNRQDAEQFIAPPSVMSQKSVSIAFPALNTGLQDGHGKANRPSRSSVRTQMFRARCLPRSFQNPGLACVSEGCEDTTATLSARGVLDDLIRGLRPCQTRRALRRPVTMGHRQPRVRSTPVEFAPIRCKCTKLVR